MLAWLDGWLVVFDHSSIFLLLLAVAVVALVVVASRCCCCWQLLLVVVVAVFTLNKHSPANQSIVEQSRRK